MLEYVCVLSFGGFVMWEKNFGTKVDQRTEAINYLIRAIILEDRAGERECVHGNVKLKWSFANQHQFFVVAVYPSFLKLSCVDDFLGQVKQQFLDAELYKKKNGKLPAAESKAFQQGVFDPLYAQFLEREKTLQQQRAGGKATATQDHDDDDDGENAATGSPTTSSPVAPAAQPGPKKNIGKRGEKGGSVASPAATQQSTSSPTTKKGKPTKGARVWDGQQPQQGASNNNSATEDPKATEEELEAAAEVQRKLLIRTDAQGKAVKVDETKWEGATAPKRGMVANWLRQFYGSRELDTQDFSTIIPKLKEKLITKNVAVEVAETVCSSVEASLAGTKAAGQFGSLHQAVENSMMEALHRILQPKKEVNILRSVAAAKAQRRPYTIVFCGVNGVGKSTSLAKISYWLQQNGYDLLIAACDTFRNGAVEQLEVHGRAMKIPIFEAGYNSDPAVVAGNAIAAAAKAKKDVVLVDTAGRMQDHESRMRALARLIHDNTPDLVLFVGEALVGNNGVDQLRKFNQCLYDFTPVGAIPRGIDGIVLTKFDTIDDKVGAAISLVYECGQPIVFVGVGQSYQDLKTLEPNVVIDALLQ